MSLFSWATRSEVGLLKTRADWMLSVVGHSEKGDVGYLRLTMQHKTGEQSLEGALATEKVLAPHERG